MLNKFKKDAEKKAYQVVKECENLVSWRDEFAMIIRSALINAYEDGRNGKKEKLLLEFRELLNRSAIKEQKKKEKKHESKN